MPLFFFYGTLTSDRILHAVLSEPFTNPNQSQSTATVFNLESRADEVAPRLEWRGEAILRDYRRFQVYGRPYPAIVAHPGARVTGQLCELRVADSVDAQRYLDRLDAYEGVHEVGRVTSDRHMRMSMLHG